MQDHLACTRSLDDNVGRLLDHLEEQGLLENTLVVYTSDQGFYMGEHGWFDKRFIYEESFRTPLLMQLPKGYNREGEVPELVQNIDHAPTILDIAGINVPDDMQGRSMVPLFDKQKDEEWRDALYYHYYEFPNEHMVKRHYGVRDDRYKLAHFYYDIDHWEFYDLEKDPNELNNLYGDPEYKDEIDRMRNKLEELIIQYNDTTAHKIFKGELEVTE